MLRAFRSEWLKMRRPAVLAAPAGMIAFTLLGTYFGITRAVTQVTPGVRGEQTTKAVLAMPNGITDLLNRGAAITAVIALILVAGAVASEYSQGTLRNLLVRQPDRLRFLAGKVAALVVFAVAGAVLAMGVSFAVALAVAPANGISTAAWTTTAGLQGLGSFVGNTLVGVVVWSLIGALFAVILRSAVAAVGLSIAYAIPVEALLTRTWPNLDAWLPGRLIDALVHNGTVDVGYVWAGVMLAVYAAGVSIAALTIFRQRDVTT